jgi:hypothetical protein
MPDQDTLDKNRDQALASALADIGYLRRGTVLRVSMPCGKPVCRCKDTPPRLHGPYYQLTRKVRGKTVTQRLTLQEAEALGEWIANARRVDKLLTQWERTSVRLTDRLLRELRKSASPPNRKSRPRTHPTDRRP